MTILFIVKYGKITLKWTVFSVVGAHNQQDFCIFKWGKNKPKQQSMSALVLSLWAQPTENIVYSVREQTCISCGSKF